MPERYVISGCSGGGKSTLIAALADAGFDVVPEPGRRIVQAGGPMPWNDPEAFARRAVEIALSDWQASAALRGPVFFDRGLVDAVEALRHATGVAQPEADGLGTRYEPVVFLVPPWPALLLPDAERRHDLAAALAENGRLNAAYPALGYRAVQVPRVSVAERVAFVRATIGH